MKSLAILLILTLGALFAIVQAPSPKASASSPAKSVGLFAYPMYEQDPEQQLKDENDCYSSAKQQTGVDAQAPPPAAPSAEEQQAAQKQAAQQAAAAVGATAGAVRGRRQQKKAQQGAQQQAAEQTAQAQHQAQAEANAKHQEAIDTFKRAFSACMEARKYSVK